MNSQIFLLSLLNDYLVIGYILFVAYIIFSLNRTKLLDYALAITIAIILSEGLKYLLNAPRPDPILNFSFEGGGFPSTHTSIAFSAFFFYLFCTKINWDKAKLLKRTFSKMFRFSRNDIVKGEEFNYSHAQRLINEFLIVLFLILSILVAYLRVYTGAHFLIDILGGIIIGFISTIIFVYYDVIGRRI